MATSTSSCYLTIDDLNRAVKACQNISGEWKELAKHLNIDAVTVLSIEKERGEKSSDLCLNKLLTIWLRQPSHIQYDKPSWRVLCDAVSNIARPLSEKIWTDHTSGCNSCRGVRTTPVATAVRQTDATTAAKRLSELFNELLDFLTTEIKPLNVHNLRRYLNQFFMCEEELNGEIGRHLLKIEDCPTSDAVLNYFVIQKFIGYLNYSLINVFQKMVKSPLLDKRIEEYQKDYQCFLELSLTHIHDAFQQCPNLRPEYPAGLPKFTIHLESKWDGKSMFNLKEFLKQHDENTTDCSDQLMMTDVSQSIVITFAVLPHIARKILGFLTKDVVKMSMKKEGISVDSISEQLMKYKEELQTTSLESASGTSGIGQTTSEPSTTNDFDTAFCDLKEGAVNETVDSSKNSNRMLQPDGISKTPKDDDGEESFYHSAVLEQGSGRSEFSLTKPHEATTQSRPDDDAHESVESHIQKPPSADVTSESSGIRQNLLEGMSSLDHDSLLFDQSLHLQQMRMELVGPIKSLTDRLNCPESMATQSASQELNDVLANFDNAALIIDYLFSADRTVQVQPILLQVSGLAKSGKTTALVNSLKLPEPNSKSLFLMHELVLSGKKGLRDGLKTLLSFPLQSFMYGIKAGMPHDYKFPDHVVREIETSIEQLPHISDPALKEFLKNTILKLHQPIITAVTPGKVGLRSYTKEELLGNESLRMMKKATNFENKLRNGVGLCNIWDIDVTETAIRSFIECFGLSFTQKCILLFIDLERDADKLEYPPKGVPDAEQGRSRLHYLFRNCQMTKRDGSSKKICHILAKYTRDYNIKNGSKKMKSIMNSLRRECKNAARQMGVEDIVDFHIIEVEFEPKVGNKTLFEPTKASRKAIKHALESIWKEQAKKTEVPISWFLLLGFLTSRDAFYISRNELESFALNLKFIKQESAEEYTFDAFCKFFASFGSIIDVSQVDQKEHTYIITKPLQFLKCYKTLLSNHDRGNGIVARKSLSKDEEVVLEVLVSSGLATILPNRHEYYLPSLRKLNPTKKYFNNEAVQLSFSISSPRVNMQIEILKHLFHQSAASHFEGFEMLIDQSKFSNVVFIRKGKVEITLTLLGPILEIHMCDKGDTRSSFFVLKTCCASLVKVIHEIISKKTKDFNVMIKYQYAILCKKQVQDDGNQNSAAGTYTDQVAAINAYQRQHVLPTSLYCVKCKEGSRVIQQYDETLKAWNHALNENPIPEEHKDGELYPDVIVKISKEIAQKDHWESVKFLAEKLKGKISMVAPVKHERQWHIMQMLIEWVHTASVQQDESMSKLLARRLIECHEKRREISGYKTDDELPSFKGLARNVDMQVMTSSQRRKIISEFSQENFRGSNESLPPNNGNDIESSVNGSHQEPQAFQS